MRLNVNFTRASIVSETSLCTHTVTLVARAINTEYGKSYLNVFPGIKQELNSQLDGFITQSENKTEPEYMEFKVYLANMKQTLFA